MIKSTFIALLLMLAGGAWGAQNASWNCVQWSEFGCAKHELWVSITSDEDTGKIGAYGIGAKLASGELAYWTVGRGFESYKGGLVRPVDGGISALPSGRQYLLYSGPESGLCALSGGLSFELYAGRGVIPDAKLAQLNWLLAQKIPLPEDHIRGAYIYQDATNSPWKVSKVFSWTCGASASQG